MADALREMLACAGLTERDLRAFARRIRDPYVIVHLIPGASSNYPPAESKCRALAALLLSLAPIVSKPSKGQTG